ncbi:MAG: hypothetical protein JSS22_04100 [Proteobacteria bacterium]|nr:hypothetical protein [Pseudomonadota bacterium]
MASVPPWMAATTFEYVLQFTEAHEGQTNFMYNNWSSKSATKDVTAGVGISIRSEGEACSPDVKGLFVRRADGGSASDDDMRAEFRRVNNTERIGGNLFTAFRDPSPLTIPPERLRPSLREKILTFWDARGASADFPDFATIPAQAQVALMSYNYGARISRAPRMCRAIKAKDYAAAALQSNMPGWDPQKNQAHRVLLLNAGVVARDGLDQGLLPTLGAFKPPPMLTGAPEADLSWLLGWWTVWDGNYYYYYFSPNGAISYIETKPNPLAGAPANPGNRGTYFFSAASTLVVDWSDRGGASTVETFRDASAGATTMHAPSNRFGPLRADRM